MHLSSRDPRAHAAIRAVWLSCLSVGLLLLVGCGAAGGSTTAGGGGGASATATPRAGGPGSGLTIRPCLGTYTAGATPAATLGDVTNVKSAVAHVGDTIEVRMDGKHLWSLSPSLPSGVLSTTSRDGAFDSARDDCVWLFHADATGSTAITFTGKALCDPTQVCPQYVITVSYDVTIN